MTRAMGAAAAIAAVLLLAGCGPADEAPSSSATSSSSSSAPSSGVPSTGSSIPGPASGDWDQGSTVTASGGGDDLLVTRVIDGDTIDVEGGERVRLIGVDTPERGACGAPEATRELSSWVEDERVRLVPGAREDTDRYGRLLRYVEVDGTDVNLEMLLSGHAVARYDSQDGYGHHPREDLYRAVDGSTPPASGCRSPTASLPSSTVVASTTIEGVAGVDPRFGTCREAKAAGYGPYRRGVDPEYDWYRDADRDGLVCE